MSGRVARIGPDGDVAVVSLELDVDYGSRAAVDGAIATALSLGRPVVVDLSDCTFLDLRSLRALSDAYEAARAVELPFVVLLPFDCAPLVRRLMLDLVSELAPFPVVPTREHARRRLAAHSTRPEASELRELRKRLWQQAATTMELVARRDELVLEQRRALSELRPHRRRG